MNKPIDMVDAIKTQGYFLAKSVLPVTTCNEFIPVIEQAIAKENEYHGNTTAYSTYGALLFAPLYHEMFLQLLGNPLLMQPFNTLLGNDCKLYTMSTACVPPGEKIYTARIHQDAYRNSVDTELFYACMIFITDVSIENGAPYYLKQSHLQREMPDEQYFYTHAQRITGKAGDVLYFNPLTWHSGAQNLSAFWRHTIIIGMCKSFIQQRFDIPYITSQLTYKNLTADILKKLGFEAAPPKSYDEYYKKAKK